MVVEFFYLAVQLGIPMFFEQILDDFRVATCFLFVCTYDGTVGSSEFSNLDSYFSSDMGGNCVVGDRCLGGCCGDDCGL